MGCECAATTLNIVKAIVMRLLFVIQSMVTTYRVVAVHGDPYWWLLLLTLVPLLIEASYTLVKRKGAEFKWFAPSFCCFLLCTVPGIWFLELDKRERGQLKQANSTNASAAKPKLSGINGVALPFNPDSWFNLDEWVQTLEQVLMMLLVLARWILPKGEITRERLSQILLVYIALASDIIELFDLYELEQVVRDEVLFYIILVAWTLSLVQFTLILAGSKSRKSRMVMITPMNTAPDGEENKVDRVEVMSLMLTLILQDVPFLCIRIYIIAYHKVMSNTLLFFASKNGLIIALQFYRLAIVVCGLSEEDRDKDGVIDEPRHPERE